MQKGTGSGGSTAWNNTVRSRWYLRRPEGKQGNENHRLLTRVKSNYATSGREEYLEWNNGVFVQIGHAGINKKHACSQNSFDYDTKIIRQLIESEALEGRFYITLHFAEKFEGTHGLGSKRWIQNKIVDAANNGYIKFFLNPELYEVNMPYSPYGYLCTDDTLLRKQDTTKAVEAHQQLVKIHPTHYKCRLSGRLIKNDERL